MKKLTSALLATGILFLLFAACAGNAPAGTGGVGDENGPIVFSNRFMAEGTANAEGFYYTLEREDGSFNQKYIDYKTRQEVFLCSRPECRHNDETCTSWIPFAGSYPFMLPTKEKLHYLYSGFGGYGFEFVELYGDKALPRIEKADLNGENRALLTNLDVHGTLCGYPAYDDRYLYSMAELALEEDGNRYIQYQLVQIDLQDGKMTTLQQFSQTYVRLIDVADNRFILEATTAQGTSASQNSTVIFAFGKQNGNLQKITEYRADKKFGRAFEGVLYLLNYETRAVEAIDLASGEEELVAQQYSEENPDNITIECVADGKIVLFETYTNDFAPFNKRTAYDVETGTFTELTLHAGAEPDEYPLPIIEEYGDMFLTISDMVAAPIMATGPDGGVEYMPARHYVYAFIRKADYWSNTANIIAITQLN